MSVAIILFGVFAMTMANATVYATLGLFGRSNGLSEIQIGTIFAASGLLFCLTSSAWGRFADRRRRCAAIVIGLAGTAGSLFLFAGLFALRPGDIGPALLSAALLAARIVYGFLAGGAQPAATAYAVETAEPAKPSTGAAWIGAAVGLGSIVGEISAALLVDRGFSLPLAVSGMLCVLAAIATLQGVSEALPISTQRPGQTEVPRSPIWSCRVVAFLFYFGISALQPTTAFFVQDLLHIDTALAVHRASLVSATFAACALIVQAVVIRRLPLSPSRLLSLGMTMCLLGFAICLLVTDFSWLLVAFSVAGFGYGLAQPGMTAWALLAAGGDRRAEAAGQMQAAMSAAWAAGPIAGTAVYAMDLKGALVLAAATTALSVAVILTRPGSVGGATAVPRDRDLAL